MSLYYKTVSQEKADREYGAAGYVLCPCHEVCLVPVAEGAIIIEDPEKAIERMLDEWDKGKAVPMGAKKRAEKRFLCARLLDAAGGER